MPPLVFISSDDAVLFGAEFVDSDTIKAELLWVNRRLHRSELMFEGIGLLIIPPKVLGHDKSMLWSDVTIKIPEHQLLKKYYDYSYQENLR
jgi:hypothetical protein